MPIHDRIARAASKGFGIIAGAAGEVFGQVVQQLPGVLLGRLGGPPTSRGDPTLEEIVRRSPGGGIGGDIARQRTLPGVPGDPLGGALRFPMQEAPMSTFPVTALPGGAPISSFDPFGIGRALGRFLTPEQQAGGAMAIAPGADCSSLFRMGPMVRRAIPLFHVTNPDTGREVWYRNIGQPILWSGDFAAVKRVRRVAGKAHRRSRKR